MAIELVHGPTPIVTDWMRKAYPEVRCIERLGPGPWDHVKVIFQDGYEVLWGNGNIPMEQMLAESRKLHESGLEKKP
jgi:hypothetical protein